MDPKKQAEQDISEVEKEIREDRKQHWAPALTDEEVVASDDGSELTY